MKKYLALFLCFVMLFSVTASASSYTNKENVNSEFTIIDRQINSNGEIIKDISTFNGAMFYFEKTEDIIISMEMLKNGNVIIYKRELGDESKLKTQYSKGIFINSSMTRSLFTINGKKQLLDKLSKKVKSNKISLRNITAKELGVISIGDEIVKSAHNTFSISVWDKVYNKLISEHGDEYSNKFRHGEDYKNTYGALYETKSFGISNHIPWEFGVDTTIAAMALAFGLPSPKVEKVVKSIVVTLGSGALGISSAVSGYTYNANVLFEKDVKVNGQIPHKSIRRIVNHALAASSIPDPAQLIYQYTEKDSDFTSTYSTIVKTGINKYLENLE